ncbi:MAG: DHH family phosphoesterase [Porticoccaceae bacterium]
MPVIDVFNGDADGICSLTQLRLAEPCNSTLVTGVKRDISLLQNVTAAAGDRVTVLDVSLDKNREPLQQMLSAGAVVFYVDHHFPGDIPVCDHLTTLINEAPEVCTSLLVNSHLKGAFARWAVVGAFGDNLNKSALSLAKSLSLGEAEITQLQNLGIYINYNGYGPALEDLHFHPAELFRLVSIHADPLNFIADGSEHFARLENGYHQDMAAAEAVQPERACASSAVFILPDQPWARRVSGVYSNDLTNLNPDRAHAVLTEKANGNFLVSVRAPLSNRTGAAELCRRFPTGGGREAAAGVNDLPAGQLNAFIDAFEASYR